MTTEEILHIFGQRIVDQLKADIKEKSITKFGSVNASGKLYDSIRYEVNNGKLQVFGFDYVYYLQYGRKPGKFPPKDAIKQWIRDKGILSNPSESELNSLAFLISRKIAEKGTTVWEQGGSDLVSAVVNESLIDDLRGTIVANFETYIIDSFKSSYFAMAA